MQKIRRQARRKFKAKTTPSKGKSRFHGEIEFKQEIAAILSVAGYTQSQIAASLGESKGTIKNWAAKPEFQKAYNAITGALSESAKTLLRTYNIEAVQTLVMLMRTAEDDKIILDAAREILDRGGLPKASRVEQEAPAPPPPPLKDDFEEMFKKLPPEQQEMYLQMQEEAQRIIRSQAEEEEANESSAS
jgi:transposase